MAVFLLFGSREKGATLFAFTRLLLLTYICVYEVSSACLTKAVQILVVMRISVVT